MPPLLRVEQFDPSHLFELKSDNLTVIKGTSTSDTFRPTELTITQYSLKRRAAAIRVKQFDPSPLTDVKQFDYIVTGSTPDW